MSIKNPDAHDACEDKPDSCDACDCIGVALTFYKGDARFKERDRWLCVFCENTPCGFIARHLPTESTEITNKDIMRALAFMFHHKPPNGKDAVAAAILDIMRVYREQLASRDGGSTPGGLEHMGDVWSLFAKWEQMIK